MATVVPSSKGFSQIVDGFQIPGMFSVENFRSALKYKPRPDDIFLVTYPKCGTTWSQNVLSLIFKKGVPEESSAKFFSSTPFLEMTGAEAAEKMARPNAIKVHLPYHLTPRSDKAKYIYVTRNPMDCCVSYFYHMRNMPGHGFNGTFDDCFELFITGVIDYGDYFDHLLGWYAHRNDPNVLFMTYEDLKENTEETILKMASFIDDELYAQPLRKDPSILQNIIKFSGIDYMKETFNKTMGTLAAMSKEEILNSELPEGMKKMFLENPNILKEPGSDKPMKFNMIRKGIIGDWRNHFSEEQSKRLKEKFYERTKGTDLPKLWEKYM